MKIMPVNVSRLFNFEVIVFAFPLSLFLLHEYNYVYSKYSVVPSYTIEPIGLRGPASSDGDYY